tara:strand:+ start:154 stop:1152 length:999 start_codon:yes stop_codon:yes gene_type:complete
MTTAYSGDGITFPDSTVQATAPRVGLVNRIINGDMRVSQRYGGASVTQTTANLYGIDRFQTAGSLTSKFTSQQSSTAPAGFINSTVITSSAATPVGASDFYMFSQWIEGLNVSDLAWGTASAATVTLSFWVRSSLTGTFGGSIQNSDNSRSYPYSYTISSANTWEKKTVTVAGDTSGTWLTTNGTGIKVRWGLGAGSTFSGTVGSWAAANYYSATGSTSVVGTSGATFYVTGVQLEKGSTATDFEYVDYSRQLQMCQRYYQTFSVYHTCGLAANGYRSLTHPFKVTMRSNATCTLSATTSSPSVDAADTNGVRISNNSSSEYVATVSATAEL